MKAWHMTGYRTSVPGDKVPVLESEAGRVLVCFCSFLQFSVLFYFTVNKFHALYLGKISVDQHVHKRHK